MMKDIDADYYGYMDDDDGILIPLEQQAEKECEYLQSIHNLYISKILRISNALFLIQSCRLISKQCHLPVQVQIHWVVKLQENYVEI